MKPTECAHMYFKANVAAYRLTDKEGGQVSGYTADVHIECAQCGVPFRFIGHRYGLSPLEPMLSADGLELRAPIEPAHTAEVLGIPLTAGNT